MEREKQTHTRNCDDNEAETLIKEGRRLEEEGRRLEEKAHRLVEDGKRLEREGEALKEHCHGKEKELVIFVNRLEFDESKGVKKEMSVNEIANLVGQSEETSIVRRLHGDSSSEPLAGIQKIRKGDQFTVTRRRVEGGFLSRVEAELEYLRKGGQDVEYVSAPAPAAIYRKVPTARSGVFVDVIVQVPQGYPASFIDRAGVHDGSWLIGRVKGSPQETIQTPGETWRLISYHPHTNGGGPAWNPVIHGFHTYLTEIIAWLEVAQ